MDSTALQNTVDTLTAAVQADQTALANDEAALATAKAELDQVTLINALEALTEEQVATISAALATDPQNTNGITISFPQPAAPADPAS